MRTADLAAYPVFLLAVPAAWMSHLDRHDDPAAAWRFTAGEAATLLSVHALKRTWPRPRPYMVVPGVVPRDRRPSGLADPTSFPSGHTAVAFNLATTWCLNQPRWYVIAPASLWAAGVGLSRIWLGVHYPSDVLAGALLGGGLAVAAHLLIPAEADEGGGRPPPARLTIGFAF